MSFSTSVAFSDGVHSLNYTHRKDLSEIEVVCFDTRNIPEIPSLLSDSIFRTLNLPLRCNSYDLISVSFIVSVRNTITGRIFGTSLDPYITFPISDESILVDNISFHPLIPDQINHINFA